MRNHFYHLSVQMKQPRKHTHDTWFKKKTQFKTFQMNCGGYGDIPAKVFGTTEEYSEFLEYCQNAMNMNGEQRGFNKVFTV